jgi:hypothetical protein
MADPEWPAYDTGPHDHMHALGVISVNYNLFERSLFRLFDHYVSDRLIYEERSYWFRSYDNEQRIAAIQFFSNMWEQEQEVRDCLDHLVRYWFVVTEKRHLLLHSALDRPGALSPDSLHPDPRHPQLVEILQGRLERL